MALRESKQAKAKREAENARQDRLADSIRAQHAVAIDLRSQEREFHGLEREFVYWQNQMLVDFETSKDVHHARDVGAAREVILRKFLIESGFLPRVYGVSEVSARVVSTTGHGSAELDIVFFDSKDSIRLMKRQEVFEVFPVESVYGVIQVKSRLNLGEIRDGLANLETFKKLDRAVPSDSMLFGVKGEERRGFGILFAYDTDTEWVDIIKECEAFAKSHPTSAWANLIVILNKGIILHGEGTRRLFKNSELEKIEALRMGGVPDLQNHCLFNFYSVLLTLLRETAVVKPPVESYFSLPLVADAHSYRFLMGPSAEVAQCAKHGDYQRSISPQSLKKLLEHCSVVKPINWVQANEIAAGQPGNNDEAYARQPGEVRIYNPEALTLSDILLMDATLVHEGREIQSKAIAYDTIEAEGIVMLVPYYYSAKEGLINGCKKCEPRLRGTRAPRKRAAQKSA